MYSKLVIRQKPCVTVELSCVCQDLQAAERVTFKPIQIRDRKSFFTLEGGKTLV